MASTYSTNLAFTLPTNGELSGTWGTETNTNIGTLIEQSISGYVTQAITDGADTTITIPNGSTGVARNMTIEMTGALTGARNLIVPANKKLYFIYNNTTGSQVVTVKVSGQTGVAVPNGKKCILVSNGTDIVEAANQVVGNFAVGGTGTFTGAATFNAGAVIAASQALTGTAANSTISGFLSVAATNFIANTTTCAVANTTATTVNAFGAASTALNIGNASGTNTVLGATTFSQAATFSSTLGVTGAATFNSAVTITSATSGSPIFTIANTNGDASGSTMRFDTLSASPAANDELARIYFRGKNSGATTREYGLFIASVPTVTAASETSRLQYYNYVAGSQTLVFDLNGSALALAGTLGVTGVLTATAGVITGNSTTALNNTTASTILRVGVGVNQAGTAGVGLEFFHTTASTKDTILAYDRTGSAYQNFQVVGKTITLDTDVGVGLSISNTLAVAIPYIWANTGGTTSVMVDSNGTLFKLASARKYKEDFADYTKGLADVLKLSPTLYRLKSANHKGYLQGGLIADDLDAQGMTEFVAYGPEGVDSISYGNMAALWVNAFKDVNARIAKLEALVH